MARLTHASNVKIVLIIILCVVICGSLSGCFALMHTAMDSWSHYTVYRAHDWIADDDTSTGSFSVDAAAVNDISISWLAGKVTVDVVDDSQTGGMIQVTETEDPRLPLRWRNVDGCLDIDYGNMQGIISCMSFRHDAKDLEVLVPASRAVEIGDFVLDAASGEYNLRGLSCASVTVNQASGVVQLDDFSADSVTFEIASGMSVYNGKAAGHLAVDQASGNAQFRLEGHNPASVDLSLASGDLSLFLPVPDFRVNLSKMSGAFNSDFDLFSKGDVFYCSPDSNRLSSDASEGGRSAGADVAPAGGSQSQITMDMMSGNFFIGKS